MPRRKQQPGDQPPSGFIPGSQIDLASWSDSALAEDANGNVHCIVGYQSDRSRIDLPYFAPSVAAHHRDGRNSHNFVQLRRGTLRRSSFFRADGFYRVIPDRRIEFPAGASSYFGVTIPGPTWQEDADLTRQVFGATRKELEALARGIARITGRDDGPYAEYPSATFSRTRSNRCDISNCLIPKEFPYIAFCGAQYEWSHVSLHGFYRLLKFLCPQERESAVMAALIEDGFDRERLREITEDRESWGEPLPFLSD